MVYLQQQNFEYDINRLIRKGKIYSFTEIIKTLKPSKIIKK